VNLDLVARIANRLHSCAVVGAYALAARGYVRQTKDFDLMTTDRSALDTRLWNDVRHDGFEVDVRKGDLEDPLAGVVRFSGDAPIDLVVAKYKWQQQVIERAEPMRVETATLRVPRTPDLILLKLFAGGYGDMHDIARLLDIGPREPLVAEVTAALSDLPEEMRGRWERLLRESRES
jgi:hypothetical protein